MLTIFLEKYLLPMPPTAEKNIIFTQVFLPPHIESFWYLFHVSYPPVHCASGLPYPQKEAVKIRHERFLLFNNINVYLIYPKCVNTKGERHK